MTTKSQRAIIRFYEVARILIAVALAISFAMLRRPAMTVGCIVLVGLYVFIAMLPKEARRVD